ncbi:MAG: hypothetical protein NTY53_17405 [Kiritimatiellaeota bacterium]|nr:hypothetical protein [Kiritimatiellota bacterium]
MTRTGKIARLPHAIREQLNRRLRDGEQGVVLVVWLNAQPEVKEVVRAEFGNRPITVQNLSEWKQGGFRDWLQRVETMELVQRVAGEAAEIRNAAPGDIAAQLSLWLIAQYAVASQTLLSTKMSRQRRWQRLRELCDDVVKLRRSEQEAERLQLIERQIKLNELAEDAKGRRSLGALMESLFTGAGRNSTVGAALDVLAAALQAAGIKMGTPPLSLGHRTQSDQIQPNPITPPSGPPMAS